MRRAFAVWLRSLHGGRCALCGGSLPPVPEVHEAFLKRNARLRKYQEELLNTPLNCFPVHRECHVRWGSSPEGVRRCAEALNRLWDGAVEEALAWYIGQGGSDRRVIGTLSSAAEQEGTDGCSSRRSACAPSDSGQ